MYRDFSAGEEALGECCCFAGCWILVTAAAKDTERAGGTQREDHASVGMTENWWEEIATTYLQRREQDGLYDTVEMLGWKQR